MNEADNLRLQAQRIRGDIAWRLSTATSLTTDQRLEFLERMVLNLMDARAKDLESVAAHLDGRPDAVIDGEVEDQQG